MSAIQSRRIVKRARCLSDAEVAAIVVRVFAGERAADIAHVLGVSAAYLGVLMKDAKRRGIVRVEVTL